jgi:hypothetical protein
MNKLWGWILGLFVVLYSFITLERFRNKKLKDEFDSVKMNELIDAVKQELIKKKMEEEKLKLQQHELREVEHLSPSEVEEYWKNKK